MTAEVWRDRHGRWRAVCYGCGYVGIFRYKVEADGAAADHGCDKQEGE